MSLVQMDRRVAVVATVVVLGTGAWYWYAPGTKAPTATVVRRDLSVSLTETGVLQPSQSTTYRSPLIGREAEITFLAREGTLVESGELVLRVDSSELIRELDRAIDSSRQAAVAMAVATAERDEVKAVLESLTDGERALDVDEATARLGLAHKTVARLREEHKGLEPLLARGFITRDEFNRSSSELERAEIDLEVLRKRVQLLTVRTRPQEEQRARLMLAQREAQVDNAHQRTKDMSSQIASLRLQIASCNILAQSAGLVVYEEFLASVPRRRVRVGDRVGAAQGIITIPSVDQMRLETSVREPDVWRVVVGQAVDVTVDAYPDLRLRGRVATIGTLGRGLLDRPTEEKRFDVMVELDEPPRQLRPEMTARARIRVADRQSALVVPVAALAKEPSGWTVKVVGFRGSRSQSVTVGESDGTWVEVLTGLREGDEILLAPTMSGRVDK